MCPEGDTVYQLGSTARTACIHLAAIFWARCFMLTPTHKRNTVSTYFPLVAASESAPPCGALQLLKVIREPPPVQSHALLSLRGISIRGVRDTRICQKSNLKCSESKPVPPVLKHLRRSPRLSGNHIGAILVPQHGHLLASQSERPYPPEGQIQPTPP